MMSISQLGVVLLFYCQLFVDGIKINENAEVHDRDTKAVAADCVLRFGCQDDGRDEKVRFATTGSFLMTRAGGCILDT
jgi:hypothetical protein